ncbi:MAG: oxaloacetate decarboxylase [Thermodesulfobacteriota bacterium]
MLKYPGKRLRERLSKGPILLAPGAPNALTARIIEAVGFDTVYVTGAGIANSFLGVPDIGLLSLTELADHVAAIREAVALPLIVDADTGFGNALNVGRTVRLLERSGANALQLEDQVFPKRCGHFESKRVIEAGEMTSKIKAAVDARTSDDLIIIARTDARAALGFEEAILRANLYKQAGADVIFVEAPRSLAEVRDIPRLVPGPQVINIVVGGLTPALSLEDLQALGYAVVIYANAAMQSAILAMREVLTHLHDHGSLTDILDRLESFEERQRLVSKPAFDALEKKYAVPGENS